MLSSLLKIVFLFSVIWINSAHAQGGYCEGCKGTQAECYCDGLHFVNMLLTYYPNLFEFIIKVVDNNCDDLLIKIMQSQCEALFHTNSYLSKSHKGFKCDKLKIMNILLKYR